MKDCPECFSVSDFILVCVVQVTCAPRSMMQQLQRKSNPIIWKPWSEVSVVKTCSLFTLSSHSHFVITHSVYTSKQTMTFGNVLCACAGAQCCIEVRAFARALQWCDEGLKAHPTDKKLLELRAAADKHKVPSLRLVRELEAQIPSRCWFLHLGFVPSESSGQRRQEGQGQREEAALWEGSAFSCYKCKCHIYICLSVRVHKCIYMYLHIFVSICLYV